MKARGVEKRSVAKRAGQNGRTCDSMRFTAALRRFIAPSKHKMPGREACMRVGTPPLHFYRRLPDKLGNIPPISCSRERTCPAISNSLLGSLFATAIPTLNAVTGSLLSLLFFALPLSSCPSEYREFLHYITTYICLRKFVPLLSNHRSAIFLAIFIH